MKVEPIPSCSGYYAGEDGNIYSKRNFNRFHTMGEDLKPLKPHNNGSSEHAGVTICIHSKRRYRKIHRLVFEAFHGSCEGQHVHHIDGDPTNNVPSNLEVFLPEEHMELHSLASKEEKQEWKIKRAIRLLEREGYTVHKG